MSKDVKCSICKSTLLNPGKDQTKCSRCERLYSGCNSLEEVKAQENPNTKKNKIERMDKEAVRNIVFAVLSELGMTKKCDKCNKLFFAKSPAQKNCGCKNEETK